MLASAAKVHASLAQLWGALSFALRVSIRGRSLALGDTEEGHR